MEKGNVLVIGNSGVGKSTLINAVLGEDRAETGYGIKGTTKELKIYENEYLPFRVIDSIGFEPTFFKEHQAISAVKKWSKDSAKEGNSDNQINVIWFCVDGTSRKLFPKAIQSLSRATSMWKSIPVVVVITKSYAIKERAENIEMVQNAFAAQKKYSCNLKKIIPVVAATYEINDNAFAPPDGITELIDVTNSLMPEGIHAAEKDIAEFKLNRKRAMAQSIVGVSATSGFAIGLAPTSFADATLLTPMEMAEVSAIARIYGIKNDQKSKRFINQIIEVGTVSTAAKAFIAALKNVPGINLGAGVINAIIAASIVIALGEGSIYAFEQVYLGNKSLDDIDWVTKFLESKLTLEFIEKIKKILDELEDTEDSKKIIEKILSTVFTKTA